MTLKKTKTTVVCRCPKGHIVRGDIALTGEQVNCPQCDTRFAFGVKKREKAGITESGVMRILGDYPVSMSGDHSGQNNSEAETRPCPKCLVAIDATANICPHCNTYTSVLPRFLRSMLGRNEATKSTS